LSGLSPEKDGGRFLLKFCLHKAEKQNRLPKQAAKSLI
jgi:hypothetical protein